MKILKPFVFTVLFLVGFGALNHEAKAATLSTGATGEQVIHIQSILKELGYFQSQPTGYYDPITENSVARFQRDFNIEQLGIVGPQTSKRLEDVDMMAHVVYGEARGESYEGQVAVAAVILNRVQSDEFPNSISGVILQRNAFSSIMDGQSLLPPNSGAYKAVKDAFMGWDPSGGAVYYYNPGLATDSWIYSRTVTKRIGNHLFGI